MRILTVMSGVVLSATGAGCLAYYSSDFSSIAFVLGFVMILSAIFLIGAFLLSSKNRLPDTVLVEGMMTLIFGFVTLNNEVTYTVISIFFGAWLTISGIIRFSQSLSVSRFDPKNWHKIMPLGIISGIFGFIMLMHSLIAAWNQLTLVGITFILNGFSQLIYAMYMVNHETLPQTEQARIRVEAKQKIAEKKRQARDSLRSLGRKEREQKKKELLEEQEAMALEKKKCAREQKAKEKLERELLLESTIRLTQEEELAIAEEEKQEELTTYAQHVQTEMNLNGFNESKTELIVKPLSEEVRERKTDPIMSWDSLKKEPAWEHALRENDNDPLEEQVNKRSGIITFSDEEINFVPPPKEDITEILEKEVPVPEATSFEPLVLEELIQEETLNKIKDTQLAEKEKDKRFTEEFSWDWPIKEK